MDIRAAFLCDSATVREGLLHVLGGGLTRLWRDQMPAPLAVSVALLVGVPRDVATLPHEVSATLRTREGAVVGQAMGGFQIPEEPPNMEPGEGLLVPIVIPFTLVGVEQFGGYIFDIAVDGESTTEIEFWVLHPDEQELPGWQG
jgi:hypothetical protein